MLSVGSNIGKPLDIDESVKNVNNERCNEGLP